MTTTTPTKPLPMSTYDRIMAGAQQRRADHEAGGHDARPVVGCPRCG